MDFCSGMAFLKSSPPRNNEPGKDTIVPPQIDPSGHFGMAYMGARYPPP